MAGKIPDLEAKHAVMDLYRVWFTVVVPTLSRSTFRSTTF